MQPLRDNQGIPGSLLALMALMAGLTVANLYYNQPLLELIRHDTNATEAEANLITVVSQAGYALGLCFIIPTGDLFSRRHIVVVCMSMAALSALAIAGTQSVELIWAASLLLGATSVVPQIFIPIAGQFSRPAHKARNIGIVLSGMLTGILASRVVSGLLGQWMGWRTVFLMAAGLMVVSMGLTLRLLPEMKRNFSGSYAALMGSVWHIVRTHPHIRLNAVRAAFGFGSMMAIWSCMAFHLAQPPFNAGADKVGLLGLCGVGGALIASRIGQWVPRLGVWRFSLGGAGVQLAAWAMAWAWGHTYAGIVAAILLTDVGLQCQQLSNQSQCIEEVPEAANRANTIFMTTYFIGGSLGTFAAGIGWQHAQWGGVCAVGALFAIVSMTISLLCRK